MKIGTSEYLSLASQLYVALVSQEWHQGKPLSNREVGVRAFEAADAFVDLAVEIDAESQLLDTMDPA